VSNGYLNIKFETLEQAEVDLGVALRAAQDAISQLETALKHKLGDWTGAAEQAYSAAQDQWRAAFKHMEAVLTKAQGHVANARELYADVERQNVSIWR
jgi:WXG100 family type VII secretion target